jgi:hypothetical protein
LWEVGGLIRLSRHGCDESAGRCRLMEVLIALVVVVNAKVTAAGELSLCYATG